MTLGKGNSGHTYQCFGPIKYIEKKLAPHCHVSHMHDVCLQWVGEGLCLGQPGNEGLQEAITSWTVIRALKEMKLQALQFFGSP